MEILSPKKWVASLWVFTCLIFFIFTSSIPAQNCNIILDDLNSPSCAEVPPGTANDGFINISTTPPGTAFFYNWSNGATTEDINGLDAGTYCVTIIESNQTCWWDTCFFLTAPDPISLSLATGDLSVSGGNDGYVIANASGGTPPFTYQWSNGVNVSAIDLLTAGTYCVTTTDTNGCTADACAVVNEPAATCEIILIEQTNLACAGDQTGSLWVAGSPNNLQYYYSWSNGQTIPDITGLAAGTYCVTVGDFNQTCFVDACFTITEPDPINITLTTGDVSVPGNNDGYIISNVSGGTVPYTYQWSNAETSSATDGLVAGTYCLTVTDANGCSATECAVVNEPAATCEIILIEQTNLACAGDQTGSLWVAGSLNNLQYYYSWSNGQTIPDITGLAAGTYCVTVGDFNQTCFVDACFIITEPDPINITLTTGDVSVPGNNDGYIISNVSGGTAAYTYQWSNAETSSATDGLVAGTYCLTVTDANGCSAAECAVVNEPAATCEITLIEQTNLACAGDQTGSLWVAGSPNNLQYYYSWSNGQTIPDITGLAAGTYCVTVGDFNQTCFVDACFTITEPDLINITLTTGDVSVPGNNDGYIISNVSGGTVPYTYQWSNAETSSATDGLVAGTYCLTVTDANGCSADACAVINEPSGCNFQLLCNSTPIVCNGDIDATAFVVVQSGGQGAPYSYVWHDEQGTVVGNAFMAPGLIAGIYTVTVTDVFGCIATCTVAVSYLPNCCPDNFVIPGYEGGDAIYTTPGNIDSDQIIIGNGNVIFSVGGDVNLNPGFEVGTGSSFGTSNDGCN